MDIKTLISTKPCFPHSSIWPRWLRWIEFQIRVKLFKQRSYFIDKWTIEKSQDLDANYGINLEDEIAATLIEEIEREMKKNGSVTWKEFCEQEK